ncbi:DegV family protein [Halobacillus salinarum]|uniref:DegV family protein n=1 Tax=Halobacillus salinarum TaxID=2932257 RepID=A0ABY4EJS7_9BACI|nr:DegV family protein [Halobacillus salinarum]UOQ44356.1 DegV family protein [Halobacillus salinarum]
MPVQLIVDGGGDFPASFLKDHHIQIVPLNLHLKEEQFNTEKLSLPKFYELLKQSDELPRSSSPSPHDFYEIYRQTDPAHSILVLSLTKGLSSTYENAVMGKEMLLDEEPEREIAVLNTKTASSGIALLAAEAQDHIEEGMPFQTLVHHMEERIRKVATLFILKTLDNVIKGGRLDKVKGRIAKTLNIKLLMRGNEEGEIEVTEKVRGTKKSIRRFIEQIGEYTDAFEDKRFAIAHCNDEDHGLAVAEAIKTKYPFKQGLFMEMGPLIATHAGEGGLVLAFFKD